MWISKLPRNIWTIHKVRIRSCCSDSRSGGRWVSRSCYWVWIISSVRVASHFIGEITPIEDNVPVKSRRALSSNRASIMAKEISCTVIDVRMEDENIWIVWSRAFRCVVKDTLSKLRFHALSRVAIIMKTRRTYNLTPCWYSRVHKSNGAREGI